MDTSNQNMSGGVKKWIGLLTPIFGIALYLFQGHLWTTPLIDGHNDLPYLLRLELKNKIYDSKFYFKQGGILFLSNSKTQLLTILQGLASHTDLARLKEGRIGGQFWSVFVEVRYHSPNLSCRH
jgi:hypothetical protein